MGGDLPADPLTALVQAYGGRDSAAGEAADALGTLLGVVRTLRALADRAPFPQPKAAYMELEPEVHRVAPAVRRKAIDTEAREVR